MTSSRKFLTVKPLDTMALIIIIVKVIFNSFPSLLLDFFNKCLELKCFPDPLKIGLVILFHKTGKEEQDIKSYRPISLLPTLGKLLEKLLLQRLNFQLKTKKLQHPLQYGFREGKSADEAFLHGTSLLEKARSLQYSSTRDRFASLSLFSNISETLLDTLRNRKVAMQTSEGPVLWEQTQGCPQGSCSGPAFWNIVADEILSVQWPQGVHIQAFADDLRSSSQTTPEKGSGSSAN
ncbi:hypothetical protein AVEN_218665-1 [Araneus ventricosus]|uniref:Reverse transcriptase domain-containing protein n=1 Tax=Araneus ventricosus TaxID=182803 RepID=A0A4Y2B3Z6_ARAVE|nr:hypothetical protein AVEN_218665-1 [Araneus ventricosus]